MYFAATTASRGWHVGWGGTFHGGWHISGGGGSWGWHIPGRLTLVLTWLMAGRGVASIGGPPKPKVLLLAKPLELQYYFAPFFNFSFFVSSRIAQPMWMRGEALVFSMSLLCSIVLVGLIFVQRSGISRLLNPLSRNVETRSWKLLSPRQLDNRNA